MEDIRVIDMEIDMVGGYVKLNVTSWFNEDRGISTAAEVVLDDSAMWIFGRRKVLVQSSLKEVVELLEREQVPVADNPSLALISQKCRELIQADWVCQLSLVHEQAKLCANWLATHPYEGKDTIFFFAPPQEMRHLYKSDRTQEHAASRVP
ncbi:hypothetical protein ACFE04_004364 [Oxalis oulophora]